MCSCAVVAVVVDYADLAIAHGHMLLGVHRWKLQYQVGIILREQTKETGGIPV